MLISPGKDCQAMVLTKKVMQEYDSIMPEKKLVLDQKFALHFFQA